MSTYFLSPLFKLLPYKRHCEPLMIKYHVSNHAVATPCVVSCFGLPVPRSVGHLAPGGQADKQ